MVVRVGLMATRRSPRRRWALGRYAEGAGLAGQAAGAEGACTAYLRGEGVGLRRDVGTQGLRIYGALCPTPQEIVADDDEEEEEEQAAGARRRTRRAA